MSGRLGVDRGNFTAVEEAQLRRLVYRAYGLRGKDCYQEALDEIETWWVETLPDRLERHTEGGQA